MVQSRIGTSGPAERALQPEVTPADLLYRIFGVSRTPPLSYVPRPWVDGAFAEALRQDKHILISGRSKQGKTSLWRTALADQEPVVVPCGPSTTRSQIHAAILRRAGASVTMSDRVAPSGARSLVVDLVKPVPGHERLPASLTARVPHGAGERFEVDPLAPVEIAGILDVLDALGTRRLVVLEDVHRLPEDVREELAVDLKVFHDCSRIVFVVVMATETGARDVVTANPELQERSVRIDADVWRELDLLAVIGRGEQLLNIRIPAPAKALMLEYSQGRVGQIQELCQALCRKAGIVGRQTETRRVGSQEDVDSILSQALQAPLPELPPPLRRRRRR